MKVKSNLEKLIVSLLVISANSGIGISTTSKNDSTRFSQFSSFGNRIVSSSYNNEINLNKPDKQDFLELLALNKAVNNTDAGLIHKSKAINVSAGSITINNGSQIVDNFDSRRQGEQIVSSEDVSTETDQSNRQDYSTNNQEQYGSEDIGSESPSQKQEQPVSAMNNSFLYENDTNKENYEDSNWYIEKDVLDKPANYSLNSTQKLTNGSNIDTNLIRNLTEGLFPIEHISGVTLSKFFPEKPAHPNGNFYHIRNNSSDQLLKSPADYYENEFKFNSTSHENISDSQFLSLIPAGKQNSNKHQTSHHLTSSFYPSKPSKRVERKYSLIDLIGQARSKANREHEPLQSKMFTSRSKPEAGNFDTKVNPDLANQESSFSSMNNINSPIDYITNSETISPRQSLTNMSHDEQRSSASSPFRAGLVEKDNSFEFVQQQIPAANEKQNVYQGIVYHSTPFRPSNNLSDKKGSSQLTKLSTPQQSRQTLVRSEPLKEKPLVSFASPNESDLSGGRAKTTNQQIKDKIHRNDPRGTSASTRSETSAIKVTDGKDQIVKTQTKDYFENAEDKLVINESLPLPPPPQSAPVTRKERLMLDLYEREIDQQIAQALYKEMRKSAEILVKSAAAAAAVAASAPSPISSNMFPSTSPSSSPSSQPVAESGYQQSRALTWPTQPGGGLVPQISESQLNPNQVEIIQVPEIYQGLETISGSDLETVVLPLMPGYSFDEIAQPQVKEPVFEPSLSQQHSISSPTFQLFPPINNGFYSTTNNGKHFATKLKKFKGKKLAMTHQAVVASPSVLQQQNSISARPQYTGLKEAISKIQSSKLSPIFTNSLSYLYSNLPKAIWNYKKPPKEHKQTSRRPALVDDLLPAPNSLFFSLFPSSTSSGQSFKNLVSNMPFNTENINLLNPVSFNKPVLRHRNLPAIEATLGDLLSSALENMMLNSQMNFQPATSVEPLNFYPNLNSILNSQIILDLINKKSANFANRLGSDVGKKKFTLGIDKSSNIRSKKDELSLGIKNTCGSSQQRNMFTSIPFPMVV